MLTRPMPARYRRRALLVGVAAAVALSLAPGAAGQTSTFTFWGRGWGHGLGMSQWGARGLAAKGLISSKILKHYYSGTTVETKPLPSSIRVGLLQERDDIQIEANGRFDLHDRTGVRRASGTSGQRWRIVPEGSTLRVFKPGQSTPVFSSGVPVTIRWEQYGTLLKLPQSGYSYKRGRIDVDINSSTDKARMILIVGFEKYLYGLGEMPSSWHTEALEAQATAGRTYALEKTIRLGQNRSVCNCAVYATTADQAYVGVGHESSRWIAAVNGTAGRVVTYADKPIQALYSSASGGFTEDNEKTWGGTPLPYLRGKCDPGDYNGGANYHSNWKVSFSASDVEAKMRGAGYTLGTIQRVRLLSPRGVSGRVRPVIDDASGGVRVEGTLGDARMSGDRFRSILGLKSTLLHHHIYGGIRGRYDALNCKPGLPTSREHNGTDYDGTSRGRTQNFERARIYWTPQTGAHSVQGGILAKYLATGGMRKWGFPTTDELSARGGRASRFEKSRIYWTSQYGAHPVYGGILARYISLGGGYSKLGLPKSDERSITGGRRQDFQNGYITWNRETKKTSYRIT